MELLTKRIWSTLEAYRKRIVASSYTLCHRPGNSFFLADRKHSLWEPSSLSRGSHVIDIPACACECEHEAAGSLKNRKHLMKASHRLTLDNELSSGVSIVCIEVNRAVL